MFRRTSSLRPLALVLGAAAASYALPLSQNEPGVQPPQLARRFTRRQQQRKHHDYVIIGSGTTALAAIEAIRQDDPSPDPDILILSDEPVKPRVDTQSSSSNDVPSTSESLRATYNEWRRHLSGSWDSAQDSSVVTLLLNKQTLRFDAEQHTVHLSDGTTIEYDTCLIASSGRPRHFYVLDRERLSYALKDRVNKCTTVRDFEQLDTLHTRPDVSSVLVLGAGFLGSEVASAIATDARNSHLKTQLACVESAPMSRYLPPYLASEVGRRLESVGVELVPNHLITSLQEDSESPGVIQMQALVHGRQERLSADYAVLASTHTDPNLRLGRDSCLEVDERTRGICVNAQLEALSGLFVAGNAATYFDPRLGRRRVDRFDAALNSGIVAGRNMVASRADGRKQLQVYRHQPIFCSRMDGLHVTMQGIGEIDSSLRTVGVWVRTPRKTLDEDGKYARGVVYYLRGSEIVGMLLWNAPDVLDAARHLMQNPPEAYASRESSLKTLLSLAPSEWLHIEST